MAIYGLCKEMVWTIILTICFQVKKLDYVKIRGIIGLILFMLDMLFGKYISTYNLSSSEREYVAIIVSIIGITALLLSMGYIKRLFNMPT